MFTNIINKQSFEFVCKSETIAALVRSDIEVYAIKQFNTIIEAVFSEINPHNYLLKIDKIEIDLGDISLGGMREPEVLSKFKRILAEKINDASSNEGNYETIGNNIIKYSNKIYNSNIVNYTGKVDTYATDYYTIDDCNATNYNNNVHFINANGDLKLPAKSQRAIELIQSFIINGEMPWWVNKNDNISINAIVQSVIRSHPEIFKTLLQEYNRQNPEFIVRLCSELKPATVLKITELIADFSSVAIVDKLTQYASIVNGSFVFEERISGLSKAFKAQYNKPVDKDKKETQELIDLLIAFIDTGLWPQTLHNLAHIAQLKRVASDYSIDTAHERRLKIAQAVNRLSVFERELVLFEITKSGEEINPIQNYPSILISEQENIVAVTLSSPEIGDDTAKYKVSEELSQISLLNQAYTKGALGQLGRLANEQSLDNVTLFSDEKLFDDGFDKTTLASGEHIDRQRLLPQPDERVNDIDHEKAIAFIIRKLKNTDATLYKYLQSLNKGELQNLALLFQNRVKESREHLQAVEILLNHPALFKYNILGILLHLLVGEKKKAVSITDGTAIQNTENNSLEGITEMELSDDPEFPPRLYNPADKDIFVIKDVFEKGGFETENEKNIVIKALIGLTHENFHFLKFLTELPVNEIEKMLPLTLHEYKQDNSFFDTAPEKKAYIENAGLCLLAPYLPSFLKRLKYLENGKFKNKYYAIRAIYLLQYIVTAKNKSPEYLLQLNKLLCGFKIEYPILIRINLTKSEKLEADNLIASVIQNWKVLKSTSIKGFRESFLQRKGILFKEGKSWTLRVEKKAYDILLDSIPWNYTMIKFTWMEKIMVVEW